ncbi:hypothetical protein LB561_14270 [Mesorhizobium sp. B292B1B]|uniref:hypothetical protein n=1 Tax=unclassified Mesorhizobium TaxID=325217 RepID=UPI00112CC4C0|nr:MULTISPECIES: hypothetical protein [unclassified Mesorhizobium]MCA0016384.1 hypothetical protein [Mesorhizobium sp. B294B1A1]MCA0038431.1 hypothetical protein [Mesorhizobium sp. B292B1B]TPM37337.1 hypothetical protein FJ964_29865 [Mesorhizobium sp. B2-3-2]
MTARRDDSGCHRARPANSPTAMARSIDRHRRLLAAVDKFSCNRSANRWAARWVAFRLGLALSRLLERAARRRLIELEAIDGCDANQKVLYLVAATLARKTELLPADVAEVEASVEAFRPDIAAFLRKHHT